MNTGFKSNKNVVYSCKCPVVWCPKYHRKILVGNERRRLGELISGVCSEHPAELMEMEIMPDLCSGYLKYTRNLVCTDSSNGFKPIHQEYSGRSSNT